MIAPTAIPTLPRGVRCHYDRVRDTDVLLGPERVLMIDQIGSAILSRVDGTANIAEICDRLAETFAAPRDVIEPDVISYLEDLAEKRLLELRDG